MDNVETTAWAGTVPWHRKGTEMIRGLGVEEWQRRAGVDWTVTKRPMLWANDDGELNMIAGKSVLVRDSDGRTLDVVGDDWNVLQNAAAFNFFHDFVAAGNMEMETAGLLDGGRIVWALAKVNDGFDVGGNDPVESYMLFTNPHQYGKRIDVRFSPIRVVCQNTLQMALGQASSRVFGSSHRVQFNPTMAKEVLGVAHVQMEAYEERALFLSKQRYDPKNLAKYFQEIFPSNSDKLEMSRNASRAMAVVESQPGAELNAGSWWQAYNAVTYMTDHLLGQNSDTRLRSAWYGQNATKKMVAFNKAIDYAETA